MIVTTSGLGHMCGVPSVSKMQYIYFFYCLYLTTYTNGCSGRCAFVWVLCILFRNLVLASFLYDSYDWMLKRILIRCLNGCVLP